jgi:prepilin-type N-terminal cleavage/methylation domain-containing protein
MGGQHTGAARNGADGFTLLELLVAAAIVAVLVVAIVSAFAGGIRVWEEAQARSRDQVAVSMALEIFQRDVRNGLHLRAVPLTGDANGMQWPALVQVGGTGTPVRLGTIRYGLDRNRRAFVRKVWAYPDREPGEREAEALIPSVEETEFSYYDGGGGQVQANDWVPAWTGGTNWPGGVRIVLRIRNGEEQHEVRRTIMLPYR